MAVDDDKKMMAHWLYFENVEEILNVNSATDA